MRPGIKTYRSGLLVTAAFLITSTSAAFAQLPVATPVSARLAAESGYLQQNAAAMNKMMADMSVKPSGDVDHDFVAMMQPHHQGAIDMAQGELAFGHNEQLTRIAQGIIVEQLQEIAAMRLAIGEAASLDWVSDPVPAHARPTLRPPNDLATQTSYLARNNIAMNTMMSKMAVTPTGDIDHDFVAMMVPHHQGAIDMSQLELRYGNNAQLKQVAQEIIVDQIQEIAMMRLALGERLPASITSPTQGSVLAANTIASNAMGAMNMSLPTRTNSN